MLSCLNTGRCGEVKGEGTCWKAGRWLQLESTETPSRSRNMGLEFIDELDAAADAGYELDAEERDIEQEVMDLMELDQQLEQMEDERLRGTKRVFFEEG